jgi:hypothetical protein
MLIAEGQKVEESEQVVRVGLSTEVGSELQPEGQGADLYEVSEQPTWAEAQQLQSTL